MLENYETNKQETSPEVQEDSVNLVRERRFRPRTVFVPLLFGLIFVLIQVLGVSLVAGLRYGPEIIESQGLETGIDMTKYMMDPLVTSLATIFMALILIPLFIYYIFRRRKMYPMTYLQERLGAQKFMTAASAIILGLAGTQLLILGLHGLGQLSPYVAERLEYHEKLMQTILPSNDHFFLSFLSVVILVPIMEELLCRGIIMGEFLQAMKPAFAALCAALIFALFHGNFVQIAYVIVPGLILSFAYYLSGHLLVPIVMHMIFNFLGGFLPTYMGANLTDANAERYGLILLLLYALSAFYLLFLFIRRRRQTRVVS